MAALTLGAALAAHGQATDSGTTRAPGSQGAPATQSATPPAGPATEDADAAFKRADANKDGKLSRQEAIRLPAVEQQFDKIDTNKDRFVSREEFEAALKS